MAKPLVSLGKRFSRDLDRLAKTLDKWSERVAPQMMLAHERIGKRWHAESVKRVPVDTSTLKQRIVSNTYRQADRIITETGSNVPYAEYTEFGTKHIAGGRVEAVGTSPNVTDQDAITIWPAKNRGIVDEGTGQANQAVTNAMAARLGRGGAQEQMPWLRPAFNSIREWAVKQLEAATEPPQI